jgi:general secretion pathway protein I
LPRRVEHGFTLLEVIVALVIASLALVALFAAGSSGLFTSDAATRAEGALERAQSHLAALGRDAALSAGTFAGDDGDGYHWQIIVRPLATRRVASENGVFGTAMTATLYDVEVVISWREDGRERRIALHTLRFTSMGNG